MKAYENLDIEFKEIYVDDIKKEVIAFANTSGGTVYVGIRKDGTIAGVEDPDHVMLQVANALRDSIRPDIMPFVQIKTIEREQKPIIEISVQTGTGRPYYLQSKGLKPAGVYVRRGSASQPLSDEGIREMIVQTSGKSFERGRSLIQELTFFSFEREMRERNLESGPAQMRTLRMIGEDGLYTNLALLLSDQCEHTIKVAVFQGTDKAVFRDRKEFTGSLLQQLEEVYQLIDLYNKTKATFFGLNRIDTRDYPEEAVREALLNCIVHRDYSFSGSSLIHIYDDRMEFVSLGGLVPGLVMEAIFMGVSQSRNPDLAAVFYRMRLIESYGTGIGKIQRLYDDRTEKPKFETAPGAFRVTLPNQNETSISVKEETKTEPREILLPYTCEQILLEYVGNKGYVTRKTAEELLGSKSTKAFRILKQLVERGQLKMEGKGKNSRYVLNIK